MPFTFADNPQLYSLEVSSSNILMIDDFEDGDFFENRKKFKSQQQGAGGGRGGGVGGLKIFTCFQILSFLNRGLGIEEDWGLRC